MLSLRPFYRHHKQEHPPLQAMVLQHQKQPTKLMLTKSATEAKEASGTVLKSETRTILTPRLASILIKFNVAVGY